MSTKIMDVIDDCVENIFERLDFHDLLNVAESNSKLRIAAGKTLSRRFKNHYLKLVLKCCPKSKFESYNGYIIRSDDIVVFNLGCALKIIRCFGSVCSQIVVDYTKMTLNQKRKIERYLGKYCSGETCSLTDIVLESCGKSALRFIEKPLRSVRNVIITDNSKLELEQLNRKFPLMTSLKFEWIQITDGKCIERKFPQLKHLQIEIFDRIDGFSQENVQNMVKKNPQLNHLNIKLHPHPELNERAFVNFLRSHYEAPGKILQMN